MMTDKYRRDGTPYPEGHGGLMEWAKDIEDPKKKIVRQLFTRRYVISTVWLGLDHSFNGKPLIFESMVFKRPGMLARLKQRFFPSRLFSRLGDSLEQDRYSTEAEAIAGHEVLVKKYTR